jgi:phospholipase/carboxylesterase
MQNSRQTIITNIETTVIENAPEHNSDMAVVMLHGYGANMHDLKPLGDVTKGSEHFTWYFPNAPIQLEISPHMDSRAWFPIDMAELERAMQEGRFRDFGKPANNEFFIALQKVQNFLEEIFTSHQTVILAGFSQGAMLASHLAMINCHKINALMIYSGVLLDSAKFDSYPVDHLFPIVQSHGKLDPVLNIEAAHTLQAKFVEKGFEHKFIEFNGGHEIPQIVLDASALLLSSFY